MNTYSRSTIVLLIISSFALTPAASAVDQQKMLEYELKQQQLQQEWKQQEVQRQHQIQQQQAAQRRRSVVVQSSPWAVNQGGRGSFTFNTQRPDRLNFASVTLSNFYNANGNVNSSGVAVVTLNGTYGYAMRGTWTMQGNLTVGLTLTPTNNAARGDRITGNLTMRPPNGASLSSITLTGLMGGNPFTASFGAQ